MKYLLLLSVFLLSLILLLANVTRNSYAIVGSELLTRPWVLKADKYVAESYQLVDPNALIGKKTLRLTYDLHGTCLLTGDASALIFDQPYARTWHYISLSGYGKNCYNGVQTTDIPLANFLGLDLTQPVGTFHIRIWERRSFYLEITSAMVFNPETDIISQTSSFGSLLNNFSATTDKSKTNNANVPSPKPNSKGGKAIASPTLIPSEIPTLYVSPTSILLPSATPLIAATVPAPTLTQTINNSPTPTLIIPSPVPPSVTPTIVPTAIPTNIPVTAAKASWSIQSVSSMKETKDRICNQRTDSYINGWVNMAGELGANYVAVETPYEDPTCGSSILYGARWINTIRQNGLKVWHRHMPLAFEGIYNVPKNNQINYLNMIYSFIVANPDYFREGDIFSPIPEPQNGGISGISYCAFGICQFASSQAFNSFLRDAMDTSEAAFKVIGLGGKIKIGYYGFDGFIAWGDNNPDWHGILEDSTVLKMGNITIDHYPEIVGDTMDNDLNELETRYPNIPIIIGEWGTITGGDTEYQVNTSMGAAKRPSVVGFNYWHLGPDGNEALITEQFTKNKQFDEVQNFYKNISAL